MSPLAVNGIWRARPRVLIIDRHEVSRAGYTALLRTEGLDVFASVASGEVITNALRSPDIAVVDVTPGDLRWLDTVHRLQALAARPRVLLTSSADRSKLFLPAEASGVAARDASRLDRGACGDRSREHW